jgi:hypothetical protein
MMSASVRETLGYVYLVTNQGTLALGRTTFSNAVWKAAELLARGDPEGATVAGFPQCRK